MTTHDDLDFDGLERDLRALGAVGPADEWTRAKLRRQLVAQAAPPRRHGARAAFGGLAASAAAALAVVALLTAGGSAGPSSADAAVIHRVLTAVTPPPHAILHLRLVGVDHGATVLTETWQETSPPYALDAIKGTDGHFGEIALGAVVKGGGFSDPIATARQQLASGRATVAGLVTIDAARLYKVELPSGLVVYSDPGTYAPRYIDDPQRDGHVVRLRVADYRYLPLTPANLAQLHHPAPPQGWVQAK